MNRSASNLDREKLNQFPLLSLVVTINPKWNQYRTIPTRTNIFLSPSLSSDFKRKIPEYQASLQKVLENEICRGREVIVLPTSHCNARSKSNSIANCRRVAKVVRDSGARVTITKM